MSNDDLVEIVRNRPDYQKYHSPEFDKVLEAMLRVDRIDFLPEKGPVAVTVDYHQALEDMLNAYMVLIDDGKTKDDKEKAHEAILRHFQPRDSAYEDKILPIGHGQTCSEPSLVAFMAYWLELREGMKVLEVGSGCGYSAAITSHLIGPSGYLVTMETIPELAELARRNLENHFGREGLERRLEVIAGDGSVGPKKDSPLDRIYLTAGVKLDSFDPSQLARHLKPNGGILLFPEESGDLIKQIYKKGNLIGTERYGDGNIGFVPLIGTNS